MNRIIFLAVLFGLALATPEPPVENTMEGLNLDPELLSRITEILSRSGRSSTSGGNGASRARGSGGSFGGGSHSSYAAPQSTYSAPQQPSYSARSAPAGGQSNFEIDEIQPAPLVAEFPFEGAGGNNGGRSGYSRGF